MSIAKSICDAIKIYTDTQKNNYDRTIQATIVGYRDEKDKALGKLKLKYQDTFIYAYVTDLSTVDSYIKGENVYVNIPNNDMSSEKTVIGLVKKLGDIALIDTDNLYYNQGASFYPAETAIYQVDINMTEREVVSGGSAKAEQISKNFQSRGSQTFLIQADFYVNIEVDTQLPQYYGLELEYSGSLEDVPITEKISLSVDDVEGDPYKIGNKENYMRQSVLITLPSANETSYIQNFTVNSLKLVGNYFRNRDIVKIKNIVLQPVIIYNTQDTGLVLRISADKLKFDSDATNNDTITLKGILKKDGIVQDLSEVECYWFEYDGQTVQTGNEETDAESGFFEYGGSYWYCLNERPKTTDKGYEKYKDQKFKPTRNSYIVKKSEFPVPIKKFKLVVNYEGQRVSHEITIENNKKDYEPEIVKSNQESTYIGQLRNVETRQLVNSKVHWYLKTASGSLIQLTIDNTESTEHEQTYSADTFVGKATLICDFFIKSEKLNRDYWCGSASCEITGKKALNSVFIENGEQVFLYENKSGNNSPIEEGARYPTVLKQLSATGYENINDINTKVTNCEYYWFIPKVRTLLSPYSSQDEINEVPDDILKKLNEYITFTRKDWTILKSTTCSFTIAKGYKPHYRDNIYVVVYRAEDISNNIPLFCEINRTNFTFAQEGESGTANTGVYCRIVPNALDGQYSPPYVAFSYNNNIPTATTDNRFIKPNYNVVGISDDNEYSNSLKYFKVQIWKQGEKVFDGTQASSPVSVLSWGAYYDSERSLEVATVTNAATGSYIFHKDVSFEVKTNVSAKRTDQWVYTDITYDNISYQCWLPFLLIYYATKDMMNNHSIVVNKNIESLPLTIHYQEDGEGFMTMVNTKGIETYAVDFIPSEEVAYTSLQYSSANSILNYSSATSLNNAKTVDLRFTKYYNEDAYDFLTFKNTVGSGSIGITLPIKLALSSATSMSLDSWNNEQEKTSVQPDTGDIFAKRYVGGEKSNNQLNGIIAGQHDVSSSEKINGYMTYNKGHQTSFINSKDGSAAFGRSVLQQVVLKPTAKGGVLQAGTYDIRSNDSSIGQQGMQINLSEPSMRFLNAEDFSINKKGELTSKSWTIVSESIYKKVDDIVRTGIGANLDISNTTAVNLQDIQMWNSSNTKTAMAFWNKNENLQYQSIITSSGAFIGRELLISAGEDIHRRVPRVSGTVNGRSISNGLSIGKISEFVDNQAVDVISLFSRKWVSNSSGSTSLVLNPYHFHFGDTSSFEIQRNGQAVFSTIKLVDTALDNQAILSGSSIKINPTSLKDTYLHLHFDDIVPRITFHQTARYGTSFLEMSPKTIRMKDCSVADPPEFSLTPTKLQLNNSKVEINSTFLKIGSIVNCTSNAQVIGKFLFTDYGRIQCDNHNFELTSNRQIDLQTDGHIGFECASITINNTTAYNDDIYYMGTNGDSVKLSIKHGLVTSVTQTSDTNAGTGSSNSPTYIKYKNEDGETWVLKVENGLIKENYKDE